ncbi:MAG TPA: hypothetical protein VEW73_05360 [Nocardioides sp.]|jgi:hypothetical protein|nr:hypothetical protein [Nocardioides sp.]
MSSDRGRLTMGSRSAPALPSGPVPRDFTVNGPPKGWEAASPQVATYRSDAPETSEVFEIVARP